MAKVAELERDLAKAERGLEKLLSFVDGTLSAEDQDSGSLLVQGTRERIQELQEQLDEAREN